MTISFSKCTLLHFKKYIWNTTPNVNPIKPWAYGDNDMFQCRFTDAQEMGRSINGILDICCAACVYGGSGCKWEHQTLAQFAVNLKLLLENTIY